MATEHKQIGWTGVDLDYVNDLIKKSTPDHDSPLIVDWVPRVQALVNELEELRREYEILWNDYEQLRTERMKGVWESASASQSDSS